MTTLAAVPSLWLAGCGNMGGALLERWLASGLSPERVTVIDPKADAPPGVRLLTVPQGEAPRVLVLAVKPQLLDAVADVFAPYVTSDTLVVSMLAGIRLDRLRARFGPRVMRIMPNTPARVGRGVTGLYGDVGDDDRLLAQALTDAAGRSVWLDNEDQFDALTGVSGSGPAYVYAFIEALAAAGQAAGLPHDVADALARDTVIGAAALAEVSNESPSALRERVTSPKGTTQAGLDMLRTPLDDLMVRTVAAAATRSQELGG